MAAAGSSVFAVSAVCERLHHKDAVSAVCERLHHKDAVSWAAGVDLAGSSVFAVSAVCDIAWVHVLAVRPFGGAEWAEVGGKKGGRVMAVSSQSAGEAFDESGESEQCRMCVCVCVCVCALQILDRVPVSSNP